MYTIGVGGDGTVGVILIKRGGEKECRCDYGVELIRLPSNR